MQSREHYRGHSHTAQWKEGCMWGIGGEHPCCLWCATLQVLSHGQQLRNSQSCCALMGFVCLYESPTPASQVLGRQHEWWAHQLMGFLEWLHYRPSVSSALFFLDHGGWAVGLTLLITALFCWCPAPPGAHWVTSWGLVDCSGVRNTGCLSRGPTFNFPVHSWWLITVYNSNVFFWPQWASDM